jgi:hypothetical protein
VLLALHPAYVVRQELVTACDDLTQCAAAVLLLQHCHGIYMRDCRMQCMYHNAAVPCTKCHCWSCHSVQCFNGTHKVTAHLPLSRHSNMKLHERTQWDEHSECCRLHATGFSTGNALVRASFRHKPNTVDAIMV